MSHPKSLLFAIASTAVGLLLAVGFAAVTEAASRADATAIGVAEVGQARPAGRVCAAPLPLRTPQADLARASAE